MINLLSDPQLSAAIDQTLNDLVRVFLLGLSTLAAYAIRLYVASLQSSWKRAIANRLVSYAEQKLDSNDDKLAYVAQQLSDHFPRLKQDEVYHLIEEAVVSLKGQLAQPLPTPPQPGAPGTPQ